MEICICWFPSNISIITSTAKPSHELLCKALKTFAPSSSSCFVSTSKYQTFYLLSQCFFSKCSFITYGAIIVPTTPHHFIFYHVYSISFFRLCSKNSALIYKKSCISVQRTSDSFLSSLATIDLVLWSKDLVFISLTITISSSNVVM